MRSVVGRVGLEPPTSALAQPHRSASGIVDQLRVHRCGAVLSGVDELSSKAVAGALGKELCTYNPRMLGPDERLAVERGIHPRQRDQVGGALLGNLAAGDRLCCQLFVAATFFHMHIAGDLFVEE